MRYDPANESTEYLKHRERELATKERQRLIEGSDLPDEDREELKAIRIELHRRTEMSAA